SPPNPDVSSTPAGAPSVAFPVTLQRVLTVVGGLLWLVSLRALWVRLREPIGIYDEGILLTNAEMVLAGKVAYRDFYTNYPPGTFLLLGGLFKLFGPSILVERWVGLVGRVACGLLAGVLAGRLSGSRFSAVTAGLVTLWLSTIGAMAFAYVLALPVALLAVLLLLRAREEGGRGAHVVAGVVLGLVSWLRHDLFAVMAVMLGVGVGVLVLKQRAWRAEARREWAWAGWVVAGAALVVVPFWLPWLVLTGPMQVLNDLYFDQVRYTMPGRVLPMPPLFQLGEGGLPLPLPALLRSPLEGAVALTLLGPVLGILAVVWPWRGSDRARMGAAMMVALSLAVLPQMMGRTDIWHAVYTVAPAVVLLGAWVERLSTSTTRPWVLQAVAVLVLSLALWPARESLAPTPPSDSPAFPGVARADGLPSPLPSPVAESRREVLSFIEQNSRPDEPIYVGLTDHRFIFINEMELYFLSGRIGATRYMQFDPNVINRLDVQQRMAEELEAAGVRVAVLSGLVSGWVEPNDTRKEGADFLDKYLKEHFEVVREVPPYVLMLRRP
ncbi:MAG TPA: hypothetical protein VLQ93_23540, partial [Myxococcaceae bacterium]|nr:hypothetical protein [Myxococcaceae bacterium]